ncbi:spidroin-1-like [Panicum virgatum]|uniref:spidroin-1-like n=1 Tax=Panicum virgatum TaxID=38727 RepID=UPI0019D56533|nr:spidroin-1-like [Panicum virgatum]
MGDERRWRAAASTGADRERYGGGVDGPAARAGAGEAGAVGLQSPGGRVDESRSGRERRRGWPGRRRTRRADRGLPGPPTCGPGRGGGGRGAGVAAKTGAKAGWRGGRADRVRAGWSGHPRGRRAERALLSTPTRGPGHGAGGRGAGVAAGTGVAGKMRRGSGDHAAGSGVAAGRVQRARRLVASGAATGAQRARRRWWQAGERGGGGLGGDTS